MHLYGSLSKCTAAEHVGDFLHPFLVRQPSDVAVCSGLGIFLIHLVVCDAAGCNLRKMRDADDLPVLSSHVLHDEGHLFCDGARNPRVNLIEDNGRKFYGPCNHGLEREHHASNLTSRRDGSYILQRTVLVGREEESHAVHPLAVRFLAGRQFHGKPYVGHSQRDKQRFHL